MTAGGFVLAIFQRMRIIIKTFYLIRGYGLCEAIYDKTIVFLFKAIMTTDCPNDSIQKFSYLIP